MERHRNGEEGRIPFRSGRFFSVELAWYFTTREGQDYGPYEDKADAEAGLMLFLRDINTFNSRIVDENTAVGR